jgi:predicted metal-dependent phosphoesterase TrpH
MSTVRVEFHAHSRYSKDSLLNLQTIVETCRRKKIDRIVITDHNTIEGALRAREIDPERVIVGEEIMTQQGELLAFFVKEEIPPGLSPQETIAELRAQGAFIGVSHPFDRFRSGHWEMEHLDPITPHVDALEIFNARCIWPGFNWQAQKYARRHDKLGLVGSDAHTALELGKATLRLPDFHNAIELKESLTGAKPEVSLSAPWIHFSSRYAVWRKRLGIY